MGTDLLQGVSPVPASNIPTPAPDQATQNRDVVVAVKALNEAEILGARNEFTFQMDRQSRRLVIQIVDRDTKEIIGQIPPEYVLRMAQEMRRR